MSANIIIATAGEENEYGFKVEDSIAANPAPKIQDLNGNVSCLGRNARHKMGRNYSESGNSESIVGEGTVT